MLRLLLEAVIWAHVSFVVAGAQLLPRASQFDAEGNLPSFSLHLGNDTASVCNSSTPGTAGYINSDDSNDNQMFFWLFESKNDPATDPVILWMSGGPGASSAGLGNLLELGPCRIAPEGNATEDNPFGWNTNATVLFVDQPVHVGFSRGKKIPKGLPEASKLMHQFLRQFFIAFPQLSDLDFYIAGESYGGSWVPALATEIVQSQAQDNGAVSILEKQVHSSLELRTESSMSKNIALKGIMIGNGLIRRSAQNMGIFETLCSGTDSLFNQTQCSEWAPRAMWCERNIGICETAGWTSTECRHAEKLCSEMAGFVTGTMHRNPYDLRLLCQDPPNCYPQIELLGQYLNRSDVKTALGVDENVAFRGVAMDVFEQWEQVGDLWKSSDKYVNYLLQENFRVLIYAGNQDLYCNTAGMRHLVDEGLTWPGHPFFRFRELIPWFSGSKKAGLWKSYEPLTYAEIFNAGHLVPLDKPEESLLLINSWIQGSLPAR